jgi:2-polyprenyl-3-methyl-5-hydroxy-6-metoxy-1,4-benzoquinol methylase
VPRPSYDPASLKRRAHGRIKALPQRLKVPFSELRGSRMLEVGCGRGECTAAAIEILSADAIGIDPFPKWNGTAYEHLRSEGRLLALDASHPEMRQLRPFDFVHSYTVFEHIERPVEALENVFHARFSELQSSPWRIRKPPRWLSARHALDTLDP